MKGFFFYAFGFIVGYCVATWQTNNKWIWTSNAANLRNFCRKRKFSVKDEGVDTMEYQASACYKGRTK